MKMNQAKEIRNVAVVGAGGMGEGIALNFAQAGLSVRVITRSTATMEKCLALIEESLHVFDEFGLLNEKPATVRKRIQPFLMADLNKAIKDCDFIVESVPEVLETKKELLAQLDACPSNVILASNTSSFPVSMLVEGMKTPERVKIGRAHV
jgi:3-hydroxybutyryl-CoA dehydrogenase